MKRFSLSPARRFLAVDVGSRCVKVLLVSYFFGRIRIHAHRLIGIDDSSQPGGPGWPRVLEEIQTELGYHPMAVSIPQHNTVSQVMDLPVADPRTTRSQVEAEVRSLSGLTESRILYDYGQLAPFGQYGNPYWITHAQEADVLAGVRSFQEQNGQVWEIVSTGNALVAAYLEAQPKPENALLVDLGSGGTVTSIIHQGQGVYVTSFAVGGLLFADHIRRERHCSAMEAEFIKNTENLLTGPRRAPEFCQLVDRWHGELVRILEDWLGDHPLLNITAPSFQVVLCGGDARMPGLLEYLREHSVLSFHPWEALPQAAAVQPEGQFAVAHGVACKLFQRRGPSASLVPEEMRAVRKEQSSLQLLHAGTWLVLIVIALVLGIGTWQKYYVIQEVGRQIQLAETVLMKAQQTDRLKVQLANEYEQIRPVLARQRQTVATVQTLALLTRQPLPANAWYVLFADSDTYYSEPAAAPATNSPAAMLNNLLPPYLAAVRLTNSFIAELSTSMDSVEARLALSELIDRLKTDPQFRKVDILSPDQRRKLALDEVIVPDGHHALSITLNDNDYQRPFLTPEEMRVLLSPPGQTNRPSLIAPPRAP